MRNPPFTFRKGHIFYFSRQVPQDLRHLYPRSRIAFSLRTSIRSQAKTLARRLAAELDQLWSAARQDSLPEDARLMPRHRSAKSSITLSDIFARYAKERSPTRAPHFNTRISAYWAYIGPLIGDRPITSLTRNDAIFLRDRLLKTGLAGSTIRASVGLCRTIVNFATDEAGISADNPFIRVPIDTSGSKKRPSYNSQLIRELQIKLLEDGTEAALALVLLSETGMRLSECAYMTEKELRLLHQIPHIDLQWTSVRRLKNKGSERLIPLSGLALEAARRVTPRLTPMGEVMVFPTLMNRRKVMTANVGSLLRRRLKRVGYGNLVIHSFRHTFRYRMREIGAPSYIADQLGGWSPRSVGERYGDGVGLEVLSDWMRRLSLQTPFE